MKVQPTTKELIAMLYERLPELFDREAPVQQKQMCPQIICFTPYECENGRCITKAIAAPAAQPAPVQEPVQDDPDEQVIRERDEAEAIADALAEKIAAITGCEVGEHTAANPSPVQQKCPVSQDPITQLQVALVLAERDSTPSAQPAVPEGWKLVPVEPTEEMCANGGRINMYGAIVAKAVWVKMLAAAPVTFECNKS